MINAEVAIPIHYGTFPVLIGDPQEFKDLTEDYCETRVRILQPGESL